MDSYVDSSHAVHPDMRRHTGGLVTFGTGVLSQMSCKQKMNSRSTNETEVIGNSEFLPRTIWFENFMKEQGYPLEKNQFFKTMKVLKNGEKW